MTREEFFTQIRDGAFLTEDWKCRLCKRLPAEHNSRFIPMTFPPPLNNSPFSQALNPKSIFPPSEFNQFVPSASDFTPKPASGAWMGLPFGLPVVKPQNSDTDMMNIKFDIGTWSTETNNQFTDQYIEPLSGRNEQLIPSILCDTLISFIDQLAMENKDVQQNHKSALKKSPK